MFSEVVEPENLTPFQLVLSTRERCKGVFSFTLCIIIILFRFFRICEYIRRCKCARRSPDLLFFSLGKLLAIHFRVIFRIKTHCTRVFLTHSPTSPNRTASCPVFLPTTRYTRDPIFNILLTERSPSTILPNGEIPNRPSHR